MHADEATDSVEAWCWFFLLLSQICDKEWHYYVINVEFPAVTLFVDGVTYEPYLVTDDWPIHASKIDTQLTVGACWQGQCQLVMACSSESRSLDQIGWNKTRNSSCSCFMGLFASLIESDCCSFSILECWHKDPLEWKSCFWFFWHVFVPFFFTIEDMY